MKHETYEIEIIYSTKAKNTHKIVEREQAFQVLAENSNNKPNNLFEEFKILLLDSSNEVLGVLSMFNGGTRTCLDNIKILFSLVLKSSAKAIVTCHNNPSGISNPKQVDIDLYNKIKEFSELHEIKYLDNFIISENIKYSSIDEGFQC